MAEALAIGFDLPFDAAIAAAVSRGVSLPDVYYGQLQGVARQLAFSIAGIAAYDQLQAVRDSLAKAMASGQSFKEWKATAAVQALGLPKHRIENIWRSNLAGNYMRGRWEQFVRNADRRPYLMLDAVNDSRTRPAHLAMDGTIRPVGDEYWKKNTPPNGFQCFLPDTKISGKFQLGFKLWYDGPAVEVKTRNGSVFSCTANHPVMSTNGWVRADHIKIGDKVFSHYAHNERNSLVCEDYDYIPTESEQVFKSLNSDGRVFRSHITDLDFYGDGQFSDGNVYIVGSNSELRDTRISVIADSRDKFFFILSSAAKRFSERASLLFSRLNARLQSFIPSCNLWKWMISGIPAKLDCFSFCPWSNTAFIQKTNDPMVIGVEVRSNLTRGLSGLVSVYNFFHVRFTQLIGSRLLSARLSKLSLSSAAKNAAKIDPFSDGFIGVTVPQRQRPESISTEVVSDDVVNVRRFFYSGHVYDFQTEDGLILASSIVTSNCRCSLISLTESQAKARSGFKPDGTGTGTSKQPTMPDGTPAQPDPGWDYNPYGDRLAPILAAVENRQAAGNASAVMLEALNGAITAALMELFNEWVSDNGRDEAEALWRKYFGDRALP